MVHSIASVPLDKSGAIAVLFESTSLVLLDEMGAVLLSPVTAVGNQNFDTTRNANTEAEISRGGSSVYQPAFSCNT